MRLLVDMNLTPRWVGVLAGAGIEATHCPNVRECHRSRLIAAIAQMASALEQGALLTIDANRMRIRVLPLRRGE